MSKYHGQDTRLYIGGYDISSLMASVTPAQEREMKEYAVADGVNGYHQMPGLTKDTMSLDGIFDDNYQAVLNSLFAASSGYQIIVPFGSTLEDRALACDAVRLNKYSWKSVVTDVNRLMAEMLADNLPWDECKLILPKAQKTTDGEHTSIDDGDASASGLVAYLQVFACGADDDLIVKIQESDDDGDEDEWEDLVTFTTAAGITTERKAVSGAVEQYLRVVWSGTPTYSATFAVVYKRG